MNKIYEGTSLVTNGQKSYWYGLVQDSKYLAIAELVNSHNKLVLIITDGATKSRGIYNTLSFYGINVYNFADYEVLAYDVFSPDKSVISSRIQTLINIQKLDSGIIICTAESLLKKLPPKNFITKHSLQINLGNKINLTKLNDGLIKNGYSKVDMVTQQNEFSIKGSLIDLFPYNYKEPFRIDFFDDIVDSIRVFDIQSQRSIDYKNSINLLPTEEFSKSAESIANFKKNYLKHFNVTDDTIYDEVSNSIFSGGIEFYLPLFFDDMSTLLDYLPRNTIILNEDVLETLIKNTLEQIEIRYQMALSTNKSVLTKDVVFLTKDSFFTNLKNYKRIVVSQNKPYNKSGFNYRTKCLPVLKIVSEHKKPLSRLVNFINSYDGKVLLVVESLARQELLIDLLNPYNKKPKIMTGWLDFHNKNLKLAITVGIINSGFLLKHVAVINEASLFDNAGLQKRVRRAKHKDFKQGIRELVEISTNDTVVHEQYGVGCYLGIKAITYGDVSSDFIRIAYADGAKLMIPVTELDLVSRYSGINKKNVVLSKLGERKWAKAKKKTIDSIKDIASDLLELYAKRASKTGFSFLAPDDSYSSFVSEFAFAETKDQTKTMRSVIKDMLSQTPMDRLICGDVGFGKTEIAMRATFIAISSAKQVAILVPTTLLSEQHYRSFSSRFAKYPVNISTLSRFQSATEQKKIKHGLKKGLIDIVIGTHKLIQGSVSYKNLGLIIIDEEHRFGVKQKETLKELRSASDVLTMSATPIPRTLNMALGELRDLSVISSPPIGRMSIKTSVSQWDDKLITNACLREIHRAGQIFILHNNIDTIDIIADKIKMLLPKASIRVAHGKMATKELEGIMSGFYYRKFYILICTTIIETGIDIPNANTIIINDAQNFGLAQLHQLRGRVGRSTNRAYAYLITKHPSSLSVNAKKRLQAISSLEELGSGFIIANHDLEIRGGGELLGKEQSGRIQAVGFNLYYKLLARTVKAIKEGKLNIYDDDKKVSINNGISCVIPEHYITSPHTRLVFYKRIASAKITDELADIKAELIDRFGGLEKPTKALFVNAKLILLAKKIAVKSIDIYQDRANIVFSKDALICVDKIVMLVDKNPDKYVLKKPTTLIIKADMPNDIRRIKLIYKLLKWLL